MKITQPEIDEIDAEMEETSDQNEKAAFFTTKLCKIYKKYDINMFVGLAGCLSNPNASVLYCDSFVSRNLKK